MTPNSNRAALLQRQALTSSEDQMALRLPETVHGLLMHSAPGNKGRLSKRAVKPVQLRLFSWRELAAAHLVAINHPRPVYYDIRIEGCARGYRVCKESGILGRKPDRRIWRFETLTAAEKEYRRRIRTKTNLQRKSVRKYVLVSENGVFGEKSVGGKIRGAQRPYKRRSQARPYLNI